MRPMHPIRHPFAPVTVVVTALALLLTACSGGGTSEATSPPRPDPRGERSADEPGGFIPDLGQFGQLGDCLQLAAVGALSAIGGIGGADSARQVEQQIRGLIGQAPPEVAADLTVMADTYRRLAESRPFDPSILEDPEFRQALTDVQQYAADTCPGGG
jgi:hypothetical protein